MTTEEWALMTPEEVELAKRIAGCRKCKYRGWNGSYIHCDYLGITGHRRGCTVDECTHGRPGQAMKKKVQPRALTMEMRRLPKSRQLRDRTRRVPQVADWITEGMREKRISASTMADMLGVSKATAYNWRDGISTPTPDNLIRLAKALSIDIKDTRVSWILTEGKNEGSGESI